MPPVCFVIILFAIVALPVPPSVYSHPNAICSFVLCNCSHGVTCPTFNLQSSQMPPVFWVCVIAVMASAITPITPSTHSHPKCHLFLCFVSLYCLQSWHCLSNLQCTVITNATCSFLCVCVTAFMASNVLRSLQQTVITNATYSFAFLWLHLWHQMSCLHFSRQSSQMPPVHLLFCDCIYGIKCPAFTSAYSHHKCHLFICFFVTAFMASNVLPSLQHTVITNATCSFAFLWLHLWHQMSCLHFSIQSSQMPPVHLLFCDCMYGIKCPAFTSAYSHHKRHLFICFFVTAFMASNVLPSLQHTVITNATCFFVLCYCSHGIVCHAFSVQSSCHWLCCVFCALPTFCHSCLRTLRTPL